MFKRTYYKELTERLKEPRQFIQVIMGPRQVGKTTMIQQLIDDIEIESLFVSADAVLTSNENWIEQQWESARIQKMQKKADEFLLVIDEIQKVTNWSESIKKLWDEDTRNKTNLKVIILGSSRLLLQQGLTESLAGRYESIYMGHWSFEEMHKAFGWSAEQYAWYGAYPGSVDIVKDELRWKKYIQESLIETSISKDILMMTRIDKPTLMKRLFELGCAYSGQILSYTKVMGQLADAGNTTTLAHYLNLLDTAGLLLGIEKYSKEVLRKRSSSPKFQVYNTALISAQSLDTFEEIRNQPEKWGRIVESTIGMHLINQARNKGFELYYWREKNEEVDFVIEWKDKAIAIEVKSGKSSITRGMKLFNNKFSPHKILLVGDSGLPWQEFIKINPIELF